MHHGVTRSSWAGTILLVTLLLPSCTGGGDEPPPVTIHYDDQSLELTAWAYCFESVCADNLPPTAPPHIGDPDMVVVEFPLADWSFRATFVPADKNCERAQRVQLDTSGLGLFALKPVGHADTYDVTLFGQGDGDLVVTFRWTTPRDGPPGDLRSVSNPCQLTSRRFTLQNPADEGSTTTCRLYHQGFSMRHRLAHAATPRRSHSRL
jgi:hypothetical protein